MGALDKISQDNLDAMADSLNLSAELKEWAARDQMRTAEDMHSIAAIAKEMHGALVENTDTMRDMSTAVMCAAKRAEDASNVVYEAVDERAAETLKDVDKAARTALENSQASARRAVEELESARTAMVVTTAVCCGVALVACVVVLIVAIGFMWLQFQAGAEWLTSWGWLALPVSMIICVALGFVLAARMS